jgi:hypothetical protein
MSKGCGSVPEHDFMGADGRFAPRACGVLAAEAAVLEKRPAEHENFQRVVAYMGSGRSKDTMGWIKRPEKARESTPYLPRNTPDS